MSSSQSPKVDDNNVKKQSSSVSAEEVSKFSSLASTWWDPKQNPLISMNPTRLSFITQTYQSFLEKNNEENKLAKEVPYQPFKGLKMLDVGCGGGLTAESFARLGADVTAIDPSKEIIDIAMMHSKLETVTSKIDYRAMSIESLAEEYDIRTGEGEEANKDLFDIICILEVIEHSTDTQSLIQAASSLLRRPKKNSESVRGGILFISTINRTIKSYGIAIIGGEYISRSLPIGTHSWSQFLSPAEVKALVKHAGSGLKELSTSGMILQPPFYDLRWKLDKTDLDVNWIGAYSKF